MSARLFKSVVAVLWLLAALSQGGLEAADTTKVLLGGQVAGEDNNLRSSDAGKLVTSYSHRGDDDKTHLEVARWQPPSAPQIPPPKFAALFNGKDLTGWRGGNTFDPAKLAAMPDKERAAEIEKWTASMKEHWRVDGGELVNDGKGDYATTDKEFGDFELLVDYKTVAGADSGIYLRGCPQVQIWDINQPSRPESPDRNPNRGSGGLFNNTPRTPGRDPLVVADKPFDEWNHFRILMVDSRVSVWLNEKLVVDHAVMENYFDRTLSVPRTGPIQLQTHGGEIRWRNIFLREIDKAEAAKILADRAKDAGK